MKKNVKRCDELAKGFSLPPVPTIGAHHLFSPFHPMLLLPLLLFKNLRRES